MPPPRLRWPADTGAASVELAVLTPAVLLVLALTVAAARVVSADMAVDHAAAEAARAASLSRTPTAAEATARTTATDTLADQHLHCTGRTVTVDTAGLDTPPGQGGAVTVSVDCSVPLAELTVPGLPGTVPLTGSLTSPVDPFRGRS